MTDYYVATAGDDEATGLIGFPWATISKVQSTLTGDQSDNTVYFNKGDTWGETYTVAGYGTSGHQFVHTSYGSGNKPVIDGEETRYFCVHSDGKSYYTIDGLEIKDAVHDGGGDGGCFEIVAATGVVIQNCDIYHPKSRGIYLYACSNCTIDTNLLDTTPIDNQYEADGIFMSDGTGGHVISHNTIYQRQAGLYVDAIQTYDEDGCTIEYNWLQTAVASTGGSMLINLEVGSGTFNIRYNILYDDVSPRSIFVIEGTATYNAYNNVVVNLAGGGDFVGVGMDIVSGSSAPTLKNNIFYMADGLCIVRMGATAFPTANLDYNLYYRESGTNIIYNGSVEQELTWSAMQTDGYEPNGINADPLFVDAANDDFHIQITSPCRNVGVDVGLTEDYDGVNVPQESNPAIGAFEYDEATLEIHAILRRR